MAGLFEAWCTLNEVLFPERSRFDVLREKLDLCHSEEEAKQLIWEEEFGSRYPKMPEGWEYPKRKIELVEATSNSGLRLDFGSGQSPKEGFEGVDLYAPEVRHRVDLWKFPLPWEDNSVEEIHCSHFLEHLPMREVGLGDLRNQDVTSEFLGKDFLFAFMDECFRILKPGGKMHVVVPNARCDRAFQDPTHRRFFVEYTFGYFLADWRKANLLDHYRVKCNFNSNVVPIIPIELSLLNPEAQARRFRENWNTVLDWSATLTAEKPKT